MDDFDKVFGFAERILDEFEEGSSGFIKDERNIYHFYYKGSDNAHCKKSIRGESIICPLPGEKTSVIDLNWKQTLPTNRVVPFCTDCLNQINFFMLSKENAKNS